MTVIVASFSVSNVIYTMPIHKGMGAGEVKLEDFLRFFRAAHNLEKVPFVDPELGWQSNQYDGKVCIGIFDVFTLTDIGPVPLRIGVISMDTHFLEHRAVEFMRANRQRNPDGSGKWPLVSACEHRDVYPIELPEVGLL